MSLACRQKAPLEFSIHVESELGESLVYSESGKGMASDVLFSAVSMCVISSVVASISACACFILKLQIRGSLLCCT